MESFAFWYKESSGNNPNNGSADEKTESKLSAVMNFNLWCECGWKKPHSKEDEDPYLDIGFKIEHLEQAEELYFFVPMKINLNQIKDLGYKFNKTELVDAVFNERYETTIAANTKTIYVESNNNRDDKFHIYQLDIMHDIRLEEFAEGTILTLQTKNIINGPKAKDTEAVTTYYFRFRIKDNKLAFLIHHYTTPHKVFQNLFRETYMIDFRYHNVRSLDKTLVEKFYEQCKHVVPITAIHFLLITKAYVDVSSDEFRSGARTIEDDVWVNYVDRSSAEDTMDLVAYHYAKKQKSEKQSDETAKFIESSELFAKFQVEKSVLVWYILFTLLLGAVGSLLASGLIEILKILGTLWIK